MESRDFSTRSSQPADQPGYTGPDAPRREGQSGDATQQVRQQASSLADTAQESASQLADSAGTIARSQADSQKSKLASSIHEVANAVGQVGQQLRQNDQQQIAGYTDQLSDQLQHLSGYVREQKVDQIVDDLQDFIRERPGLVLGGAFALGLLGSRFLKSSSGDARWRGQYGTRGRDDPRGYARRRGDRWPRTGSRSSYPGASYEHYGYGSDLIDETPVAGESRHIPEQPATGSAPAPDREGA